MVPGRCELVTIFVTLFVLVFPFWKITEKAGFPRWWSLAILVPLLNFVFIFFLALADWPALRGTSQRFDE